MDVSETCTEKLRQMGCVRRCEHISTPEARCLRWLSAAAQEVSLFYVAEEVYYTYQIRGCRIVLVVEKQFQVMFIGRRTLWLVLSPSLIKGNLLLHCTWTRGRSCLSSEPNPGKALPFPCLWGPCYSGDRVSNAHALRTLSTPHRSLWFILYCVCVCVLKRVSFFSDVYFWHPKSDGCGWMGSLLDLLFHLSFLVPYGFCYLTQWYDWKWGIVMPSDEVNILLEEIQGESKWAKEKEKGKREKVVVLKNSMWIKLDGRMEGNKSMNRIS